MADKAILDMVDAWLTFAKGKGLTTPSEEGESPEDYHVMEFIIRHLKDNHDMQMNSSLITKIRSVVNKSSTATSDKSVAQVKRLKTMILDKLTPEQQKQLKAELENAAG